MTQIKPYPKFPSGRFYVLSLVAFLFLLSASCKEELPDRPVPSDDEIEDDGNDDPQDGGSQGDPTGDFTLANIDFSNWKVTLPIQREDGKPVEVEPPEILDYATNETLKPFMYNDSTDGSVVFYTYPGSTTANSSYSRTELREQMVPGSNSTNWTFREGGTMRGTLSVPEISNDADGDPHRTMVMQIHGRLTNQQRDLIGEDDNNAPPVLKVYWRDGRVYVRTKVLKDINVSDLDMLRTSAWTDDSGRYFSREVGTEKFTLEVKATDGRMTVTLDDDETFVYEGIHMQKWGIFENYFKAGNYLQTRDEGASARVKYYELTVTH